MHNQLTRTDTNETIVLPQDLRWTDEHEWSTIAQSEPQRTFSGSLKQSINNKTSCKETPYNWFKKTKQSLIQLITDFILNPLRKIHALRKGQ